MKKVKIRELNILEGVFSHIANLSWWIYFFMAVMSLILLDFLSPEPPAQAVTVPGGDIDALWQFFQGIATPGYFFLPSFFFLGALISLGYRRRQKRLFGSIARSESTAVLRTLSRRNFVFLVKEYFHRSGFSVEEMRAFADRDVDFVAVKDRESYLISCLPGSMADFEVTQEIRKLQGYGKGQASGAMLISAGEFKGDDKNLARDNNIILMDGRELHGKMQSILGEGGVAGKQPRRKSMFIVSLFLLCVAVATLLYRDKAVSIYSAVYSQIKAYLVKGTQHKEGGRSQIKTGGETQETKELIFDEKEVQQAMKEVLREKHFELESGGDELREQQSESQSYHYVIELNSGGWIYSDNIEVKEKEIVYTSGGIVVSLDRAEVKSVKRLAE